MIPWLAEGQPFPPVGAALAHPNGLWLVMPRDRIAAVLAHLKKYAVFSKVALRDAGDTLTVMGVPVATGLRMAVDRNENGLRDGDEPRPTLQIVAEAAAITLRWPLAPAGFELQTATDLAAGRDFATALGRVLVANDEQCHGGLLDARFLLL